MGIPYYFASLIRTYRDIVSKVTNRLNPDIFAIDFNCLIHQYMDETNPIESIVNALRDILDTTCKPTKHLYIGMDGMVPYGKMVQQRYRRFRIPETQGVFDRHQISPETPYMKELATAIRVAFPYATVSCTSEKGEGEHKLLNWMKTLDKRERRSICVYGLDADLILLTLANKTLSLPHSFTLLRENMSFHHTSLGFSTMSIWKLADKLEIPIEEYTRLCVLCFGNDFIPSLGMFSLREGGYERALRIYKESKCSLNTREGRALFLKHAYAEEARVLLETTERRQKHFERSIVSRDGMYLKERYNTHILDGVTDIRPVVEAFWKTYHWTVAYFLDNTEINWAWYYPYPDAPLVCQLYENPEPEIHFDDMRSFTPTQQLQFILPSRSLRTCKKRVVYPDELYHEETDMRPQWMKQYTWESKPRISLPSERETRIEPWGT